MRNRNGVERRVAKGVSIAMLAIVVGTLVGFVVRALWNWLMPGLFGWHTLTFWQALGLLLLAKILFGGFRGGGFGRGRHWRHRMGERWERMSDEEREKFKQAMEGRYGRRGWCRPSAADEPSATREAAVRQG